MSKNPYSPPQGPVEPEPMTSEYHPTADPRPPTPEIEPGDEFVVVHATHDAVEADALAQVLESQGIATVEPDIVSSAIFGSGTTPIRHLLRVPASKQEEAREIIRVFSADVPDLELPEGDDALQPEGHGVGRFGWLQPIAWVVLVTMCFGLFVLLVGFVASLFGWW